MATHVTSASATTDTMGTTALTTGSVSVQSGDLIVAWSKFEEGGAGDPVITISDTGSGGTWAAVLSEEVHSSQFDLHGQMHWALATGSASVTVSQTLSLEAAYRQLNVHVFRPSGTFSIGTSGAGPVTGEGTGTAFDAGDLTASGAGVVISGVGCYAGQTFTQGSGWTAGEVESACFTQYKLLGASGAQAGECSGDASAAWVSQMAFWAESGGADTTPDAFSFTDQTGVALSTNTESAAITVAGINAAATITVSGGEYKINSGSWVSSSGSVNNGDSVYARHTSSGSYLTATNTVVTIGGVSDTFTSTTLAPPYITVSRAFP
jgi:hypothetical protein